MDENDIPQAVNVADNVAENVTDSKKTVAVSVSEISPAGGQISASEHASKSSSGRFAAPRWLSWFEIPFKVNSPYREYILPEATGWSMDSAARGPLNQVGAFLGTALLGLAARDAGCDHPLKCDTRVYGMKPSSLLLVSSLIVALSAAMLMPIIGAIVDHTRHRKLVGAGSALILVVGTAIQISVSQSTWFIAYILETIGGFMLLVHIATANAYLADLTDNEDELAHYTSRFNLRQHGSQIMYTVIVVGGGMFIKTENVVDSNVAVARIATVACTFLSFLLMGYSWTFLFRKRPPLSQAPEGSNLLTTGFVQVGKTSVKIFKEYSCLKWFIVSLLVMPEPQVALSIIITFLTVDIQLSARDIGLCYLAYLSSVFPGSYFAKWACIKMNPLNSYRGAMVVYSITLVLTPFILTDDSRKNFAFLFAVLWGLANGWIYPSQRVLFCTIIPKGQETEMMGLFTFAGQIIAWVPPILATVMNENGVSGGWNVALIAAFVFASSLVTLVMGSYETSMEQVSKTTVASKRFEETQENKASSSDVDADEHENTEDPVDSV